MIVREHGMQDEISIVNLLRNLLWALLLMKCYGTEEVMASMADTTAKTYRNKVWVVIKLIATLDLI